MVTLKIRILVAVAVCTYVVGCSSSVPTASSDLDASAKQFAPDSDNAKVYVCRQGAMVANMFVLEVVVDSGIDFSNPLAPNTFQMLNVPPGRHTLRIFAYREENQGHTLLPSSRQITVEAGKNYFYEASIAGSQAHLEALNEQEGTKLVRSDRLAISQQPIARTLSDEWPKLHRGMSYSEVEARLRLPIPVNPRIIENGIKAGLGPYLVRWKRYKLVFDAQGLASWTILPGYVPGYEVGAVD